jgi:hypothetical protein
MSRLNENKFHFDSPWAHLMWFNQASPDSKLGSAERQLSIMHDQLESYELESSGHFAFPLRS